MSKKRASEATVSAFIKAVYPEFTELAIASNGEEEILRDATAELTRLRALAARAEDVEGIVDAMRMESPVAMDIATWNKIARAVVAHIKEGK